MNTRERMMAAISEHYADGARWAIRVLKGEKIAKAGYLGGPYPQLTQPEYQFLRDVRARLTKLDARNARRKGKAAR